MSGNSITITGFETQYTADGRPVDYVSYVPRHMRMITEVKTRIKDVMPTKALLDSDNSLKKDRIVYVWEQIEKAYDAWKKGEELPEFGTPLAAWSGLNKAQAEVLKRNGYKTVEDLAVISDSDINRIPLPNLREIAKQAGLFLTSADQSKAAKRLSDQDDKISALQEQLAAAMQLLEEQKRPRKKEAA